MFILTLPAALRAASLHFTVQIVTALRAMPDIWDLVWQGKPRGNAAYAHGYKGRDCRGQYAECACGPGEGVDHDDKEAHSIDNRNRYP